MAKRGRIPIKLKRKKARPERQSDPLARALRIGIVILAVIAVLEVLAIIGVLLLKNAAAGNGGAEPADTIDFSSRETITVTNPVDPLPEESEAPEAVVDPDDEVEGLVSYGGKWYVPKEGLETVLFIGTDKGSTEDGTQFANNNGRCDTLLLFVIDNEAETYSILQLNRDTMCEVRVLDGTDSAISFTEVMQLAYAHAYGTSEEESAENTVEAVSSLLYGATINRWVSMDYDVIPILTEAVGGVPITIDVDMTAYDPAFTEGAEITLSGEQALAYLRARKELENDENTARMERQQLYINAWRDRAAQKAEENPIFILNTLRSVSENISSDSGLLALANLAERLSRFEQEQICVPEGESRIGETYREFYVNERSLQQLILSLFYNETELEQ